MIEGVHRKAQRNMTEQVGYGYIVLPYGVSRLDFIESAYRKEKVSILPDQGSSYIHECYITKSALREIVFPNTVEELGSAVVYVTNHFNNKPFIIGVLSKEDETDLFREYSMSFNRNFRDNRAGVDINAQQGEIVINVTNTMDAASILMNCIGQAGTKVMIQCNGEFFAEVDNRFAIQSTSNINFTSTNAQETEQSSINLGNNVIDLVPQERLNIGTGEQPIPRGSELISQLNTTNQYLSTLQSAIQTALTTIDGTAGSVSAPTFMSTMSSVNPGDYGNVNSETSFTD